MHMQLTLDDPELFGNDAGEDEKLEVLASYFFDQPAFEAFLDPMRGFRVARARKGMGKSALLAKHAFDTAKRSPETLIVRCLRSNLVGALPPPAVRDFSLLENYWKQVISHYITLELGKTFGVALSDARMVAVESAELAGFRDRNFVGSLLARLKGKIGVLELVPQASAAPEQLLRRLTNAEPVDVLFMLDDVDSRFRDNEEERALVSAFFSAARALVREVKGLKIRATVRSDVWSLIKTNEDLDKCEQYVEDIRWSGTQLDEMLVKKILAYVKRHFPTSIPATQWNLGAHDEQIMQLAFTRRMKWGDATVQPSRPVQILSGGRPRWMAQLCRLAGKQALQHRQGIIGISEINAVMGPFGRLRLDDLYKEHGHQFDDLKRLIESFANGIRRFSTTDLVQHLVKNYITVVGTSNIPAIDGSEYVKPYQLAHFLFKTGFLVGHNQGRASLQYPEFVSFDLRPELLTAETNLDDGLLWEIQPSYRTVLRIH